MPVENGQLEFLPVENGELYIRHITEYLQGMRLSA